jgi:hypothetical protein
LIIGARIRRASLKGLTAELCRSYSERRQTLLT